MKEIYYQQSIIQNVRFMFIKSICVFPFLCLFYLYKIFIFK